MTQPWGLAHGFMVLFSARFGMTFCAGGVDPVFQVWLSKVTPEAKRGLAFGWSSTARSIGWVVAPLVSGLVAARHGIRSVFFVGAALYLALIPMIALGVRGLRGKGQGARGKG